MQILVDRYVTTAVQDVPDGRRADVAREIRTAIGELVEQRLEAGEPEVLAVRESLNELGNPTQFAAAYDDSPRYLIGPGWYPAYIALLKRLLPIGLIGLASFSIVFDLVEDPGNNFNFAHFVSTVVDTVYNIGIQILLWVTVGFIIAERTIGPAGPKPMQRRWTIDDLPEHPMRRRIGLRDTLPEVLVLLLAGILVIVQHVRGFGVAMGSDAPEATRDMPLLNPDLVPGWAIAFFGLLAVSIIVSLARYWQGAWTRTIFVISLLDDALWIGFISILAATKPIFNIDLMRHTDEFGDIWGAGDTANLTAAAMVIAVSVWSMWEAWKAYRNYQQRAAVFG
jgi:hypothetical protein